MNIHEIAGRVHYERSGSGKALCNQSHKRIRLTVMASKSTCLKCLFHLGLTHFEFGLITPNIPDKIV